MHPEAREGFAQAFAEAVAARRAPLRDWPIVLDLGGADNNGNCHDLLPDTCMFDVLDKVKAPGVNIVADATVWNPTARYDIVIATEVFEHCAEWPAIVATAHMALHDNGIFITTAASDGRQPHGAWGAPEPGPGEWYQNVPPEHLAACLEQTGFRLSGCEYRAVPGDVYAWGIK